MTDKKWHNKPSRGIATVVTDDGKKKATGHIREWNAPAVCTVQVDSSTTRVKGVLYETWLRRRNRQNNPAQQEGVTP